MRYKKGFIRIWIVVSIAWVTIVLFGVGEQWSIAIKGKIPPPKGYYDLGVEYGVDSWGNPSPFATYSGKSFPLIHVSEETKSELLGGKDIMSIGWPENQEILYYVRREVDNHNTRVPRAQTDAKTGIALIVSIPLILLSIGFILSWILRGFRHEEH